MLDGIQSYAAKHARGLIAQARSHPRVGRFMKAEGKHEDYKFEQLKDDLLFIHECTASMVAGQGTGHREVENRE